MNGDEPPMEGEVREVPVPRSGFPHRIHTRNGDVTWTDGRHLHRPDGPAVERADGTREWWVHGHLHREDGPAVITADGDRLYFSRGRAHREGGPARVRANGDREWFRYGYRHRLDGPAVMHTSGRTERWVEGRIAHTGRAFDLLRAGFAATAHRHDICDPEHTCQGIPVPAPRSAPVIAPWLVDTAPMIRPEAAAA